MPFFKLKLFPNGGRSLFAALMFVFFAVFPGSIVGQDKNAIAANQPSPQSEQKQILQREQWFARGRVVPGENASLLHLRAEQQARQMRNARAANEQESFPSGLDSLQPNISASGGIWTPLGPAPLASDASGQGIENYGAVSGRATAIAIDPADTGGNTVYIGGAYGGVWKSQNAANSDPSQVQWVSLTDGLHDAAPNGCLGTQTTTFAPTLATGSLVIQPGNTDSSKSVILVGTGEPDNSIDSYYGVGILRFTNGGNAWCLISQAASGQSFAGLGFSKIAFSTANPNTVVAAAAATSQGLVEGLEDPVTVNRGIYYSADAGQTWNYATIQDAGTTIAPESVTSVVYNAVAGEFFAAVRNHGFYSSADGVLWSRLPNQPGVALSSSVCPTTPTSGGCPLYRGEISVVPGRNEMYVWFISLDSAGDQVDQGIWATSDGGNTWTSISSNGIVNCGDQEGCGDGDGAYNLALAAVPDGAGTDLYAGSVNLYKCEITTTQPDCTGTGVNQFQNLTHAFGCAPDLGSIAQVHPDQHVIAFTITSGHSLMYFANDGGIYRVLDGYTGLVNGTCGTTNQFDDLNQTVGSMTQFVSFSQHPSNLNTLLGGAQGNGSPATSTAESSSAWLNVNAGDGGFSAINPANPLEWFTENTDVSIQRCTNGINCHSSDFVPIVEPATVGGDHGAFYTPYILDPQTTSSELIVGTCRVWRGPGSGGVFTALSSSFETGAGGCTGDEVNLVRSLTAGGITDQNGFSNVIYAGTTGDGPLQSSGVESGRVWVTTNAAGGPSTWVDVTNGINPDEYPVASIAIDPSDLTGHTAYVAIMGFHVSHVWKTTSAGATWTDFSGAGNSSLPDSPANALVVDGQSGTVYVGTDVGVFSSSTSSAAWTEVGPSTAPGLLPNVAVTALQIFNASGIKMLRASTYGRGVWQLNLLAGPDFAFNVSTSSQTIFPGQTATFSGTVSSVNGYSSQVALTCAAAGTTPPQTCNVSPGSITPSVSGASFSVVANDAVGDYAFKVIGTGTDPNTTTHTAPLTLHVVDFTLDAPNPAIVTVPHGNTSSSLPFTVSALGSFNGVVNLSCSGLPSGATCTFAPSAAVNPTSAAPVNANVTVTVPESIAIASSTVTISATTNGASTPKTQTFTLNVVANPDFALSAGPAFPSVKSGGTASGTISVTAQDGFFQIVALTCLVNGSSGSCSASPNALNSFPANPAITVNASGMAAGASSLTITGTSGTSAHTVNVPFQVSDYQIAATAASSPPGQTVSSTLTITPENSYSGSVALSCDTSVIPGASCTFNPASPVSVSSGPVQVTVNIAVPANIQGKAYSIPVNTNDTAGAPQHSTSVALTIGGDFSITALIPSLTIQAGQSAQFSFNVSPMNGTFNSSISFSCTGSPTPGSCSFSPSSATPGNATDNIAMNIPTTAPTAMLTRPFRPRTVRFAFHYAFLPPLSGLLFWINGLGDKERKIRKLNMRKELKRVKQWTVKFFLLSILTLIMIGMASCGGGLVGNNSVTAQPGTAPGTYTISVTATSGSLSHSTQVTLIIQ
jgi:hypothetical protein